MSLCYGGEWDAAGGGDTDFSFLDAGVDGVQQVGPVLVTLGEFGQFLPDQLPLVVAHHAFKRRVHVLEGKDEEDGDFFIESEWFYWVRPSIIIPSNDVAIFRPLFYLQ